MPQTKQSVKHMERDASGRFARHQVGQHPCARAIDRKDLALIRRIVEQPLESQEERARHLRMGLSTVQHREGRDEFKRELAATYWRAITVAAAVVPRQLVNLLLTAEKDADKLKAAQLIVDEIRHRREEAERAGVQTMPPQPAPQAAVMLNLFGNLAPEQQAVLLESISTDQRRTLAELTSKRAEKGADVPVDVSNGTRAVPTAAELAD